MSPLLRKLIRFNWVILAITVALCILGVIAIYSATFMREQDHYLSHMYRKQAVWVVIGLVICFFVSITDYRWVRWGALPLYALSVGLLVLTHFKGKKVFGARSWLDIGGFSLQPSQLAIVSGILVVALILTELRRLHPVLKLVLCGLVAAPPMLLVAMQPQLGGVIVWGPVVLAMLFVSGMPLRYLLAIFLCVVAVLPLAANFGLKEFQRERLLTFLHPEADPQGSGWTITQSLTAIGSGGLKGKGFRARDTLVEQGLVPTTISHTDFIFTVVGEYYGFVGTVTILGLFAALLICGLHVAHHAEDQLGLLLVTGIMTLIFTHVFMNTGMTVSLVPIAGLPLPLISYGGTFTAIILFAMGLVQSVWIHRKPT